MGEEAKKFTRLWGDRPPRFTLKAGDRQELHFIRANGAVDATQTRVVDVSAGGMAFLTSAPDLPSIGEIVQVEMKILNVQQAMSRKARVVRLETLEGDPQYAARVAVRFFDKREAEVAAPRSVPPPQLNTTHLVGAAAFGAFITFLIMQVL